jgi:hypothetical protein
MNLAYIPFIEPLNIVHTWWYLLLIPLAFGISVIYKALRVLEFETFWRQVVVMTAQVVAAMIALALALVFLVEWLIPRLPVG